MKSVFFKLILIASLLIHTNANTMSDGLSWEEIEVPSWPSFAGDSSEITVFDERTGKVWLIGGYNCDGCVATYDVNTGQFTNESHLFPSFTHKIELYTSTSAVMIGDNIYFNDYYNPNYIQHMNINQHTFNKTFAVLPEVVDSDPDACLVTNEARNKLFLTGWLSLPYFIYLDIAHPESIHYATNLPILVEYPACVVKNDILYIIGGGRLNITYTNISDPSNLVYNEMEAFPATFEYTDHMAVLVGSDIFIFGGEAYIDYVTSTGLRMATNVFVIDTLTNTLYESPNSIPNGRAYAPAIYDTNQLKILSFGGWDTVNTNVITSILVGSFPMHMPDIYTEVPEMINTTLWNSCMTDEDCGEGFGCFSVVNNQSKCKRLYAEKCHPYECGEDINRGELHCSEPNMLCIGKTKKYNGFPCITHEECISEHCKYAVNGQYQDCVPKTKCIRGVCTDADQM